MGSDPKLEEVQSKQDKRKEERRKQARADSIGAWADMKTKTFTGKLKGYDGSVTDYTIDLGEAFDLPAGRATDSLVMYDFKSPDPDIFVGPHVSIRRGYGAPDLDSDVASEEQLHRKVTKKEKLDDGHVIVSESDDGSSIEVKVSKKAGAYGSVHCDASLYSEDLVGAKDKLVPWLVKMCSSLTLKKGG
jgi:hypothetical protein